MVLCEVVVRVCKDIPGYQLQAFWERSWKEEEAEKQDVCELPLSSICCHVGEALGTEPGGVGGVRICPHFMKDQVMQSRMGKVAIMGIQMGSGYVFENVSTPLPIPQGHSQEKLNFVSIQLALHQKRGK